MKCPICKTEIVKAKATDFGQEYDFCRVCKKELAEMSGVDTAYPKGDFSGTQTGRVRCQSTQPAALPVGVSFQSQKPPFKAQDKVISLITIDGFTAGSTYCVARVLRNLCYGSTWELTVFSDDLGVPNSMDAAHFKIAALKSAIGYIIAWGPQPCTNTHVFDPRNAIGACNCGGFIL